MHVVTDRLEIAVAAPLHNQRLVPAAEEVSELFLPVVEPVGVNPKQPLHPIYQIGPRGLDHQMKMIAH